MAATEKSCADEIDRELSLISLYESELKRLKRKLNAQKVAQPLHSAAAPEHTGTEYGNDSEQDPLDWILQQQQTSAVSNLLASIQSHESLLRDDIEPLQTAIRQFEFTTVDKVPPRDGKPSSPHSAVSYSLKGHFLANESIHADFVIDFQLQNSRAEDKMTQTTKILGIICNLSSINEPDRDLSWLAREAKPTDSGNFASFVTKICSYLEFDVRREACLTKWGHVTVTRDHSKYLIEIPLDHDNTGTNFHLSTLSIVWGWKWKDEHDVLRLTQTAFELGLKQQDLDFLVQACGTCEKAIGIVLAQTSGDTMLFPNDEQESRTPTLPDVEQDADQEDNDSLDGGVLRENASLASSTQSLTKSPSGRRRSDYEVQRLLKIQRNQQLLEKLGLSHSSRSKPTTAEKRRPAEEQANQELETKRRKRKKELDGKRRLSGRVRLKPVTFAEEQVFHRKGSWKDSFSKRTNQIQNGEHRSLSGRIAQPRGRPPTGCAWDTRIGMWVKFNDTSDRKQDAAELMRPSSSVAAQSSSTLEANYSLVDGAFSSTRDGTAPQMNEYSSPSNGTFPRPRGRPLSGHSWDERHGIWVPGTSPGKVSQNDYGRIAPSIRGPTERLPETPNHPSFEKSPSNLRNLDHSKSGVKFSTPFAKTIPRPRGRPRSGHSWDEVHGVWVPLGKRSQSKFAYVIQPLHDRTEKLPETPNHPGFKKSVSKSSNRDLPKSDEEIKSRSATTFPRPRGRPPIGCYWDETRGCWATQLSTREVDQPTGALAPKLSRNSIFDTGALHVSARSAHINVTDHPRKPTDNFSGRFPRPRGRPRAGCIWDEVRGLWIPEMKAPETKPVLTERPTIPLPIPRTSSKSPSVTRLPFSLRPDTIQPKSSPVANSDGTYGRPRGKAPLYYGWDTHRGVWVSQSNPSVSSSRIADRSPVYESPPGQKYSNAIAMPSPAVVKVGSEIDRTRAAEGFVIREQGNPMGTGNNVAVDRKQSEIDKETALYELYQEKLRHLEKPRKSNG
ncbi:predicted protein [Phaeodactylum tricornutum CCAP 1055/1]|uniref:Uncharacterized protein n=1 Tax=Phaeodactylum tricornutum (strain CCAP 1055/1) TaxID=556484 RepID=B7G4Q5_PHATC|nr:predicted protein [Phaeodactylum tricornutum CCAP 1055/1]EEC46495.1 predicted protein [Phaeodactylum tricornutum CCAP 1055/1]|eukprot:XP_002181955.1 predicted protein [Phaeodactylum tricornutum CCAP 1055/1]